jgi:6-phosphogluconolactonase
VPGVPGAAQVGPAYVSVDHSGRFLLAANYRGHNAVVFALDGDGRLGPLAANVSAGEHAHCIVVSPDNRTAFVPHLGADLIAQYHFAETTGALTPHERPMIPTAKGSGPRHLAFSPDGKRAYLIAELDATLYGYDVDATAGLRERFRIPTLPADYEGRRWAADVHVHPRGRIVYVSNRAHDSIAVFAVDDAGGAPTLRQRIGCGGKTPRNFALDPSGRFAFVANQDSNNLVTFAIDAASGQLTAVADRPVGLAPYYVHVLAT